MIGIKPDTDLSLNSIDEIFEFLDGGENDFYAYVFDNNLKAETTDGRKCSLNLLNLKGESFNKYLLDKKMALPLESEINLIRNIAINVSSKESFVSKFAKEDKKSWCEEENLQILNCEERLVKSSEFNTKPEHGLEKYLSELPEDLFENENELNFLKEVKYICINNI